MKLRTRGRGRGYSPWRGLLESVLAVAYRGDWPAALWGALPWAADVAVVRHQVTLPPGGGRALRMAFVSDLHVGPTTPARLLRAAFDAIRREQPDILLLGGDYIFLEAEARRLAELESLVASIRCPMKLAVLGNHDLWTHDWAIVEALARAGARVLVNEVVALPEPWSDAAIVGLDDPWTGHCDAEAAAAQLDGQPFRVVLCHSPDGLNRLSALRFDAFVAGHTHGGQIATPWGAIVLPHGRLCRQFPAGPGSFGGGFVYVSRGVGGVELPIRTFAPPEIMLLELTRPPSGSPHAAPEPEG